MVSDVILSWGGGSEECHSQATIDYMRGLGFSEFEFVPSTLDPRPDIVERCKANGVFPVFNVETLWIGSGFSPSDLSWAVPQLKAIIAAGWKGFTSEGLFGPQVETIRQIGPYEDEGGENGENLIGGYYGHWLGQATAHYMECYHSYALDAMRNTLLVNNADTPNEMGLTFMMYPQTADLEMNPEAMKRDILDWGEANGIKWKAFKFWNGFEGCPSVKIQDGTFLPLLNMLKNKFNIVKRTGWGQTSTSGLTKLSLFTTNPHPAVAQKYTVYGFLKDADGKALANKPVDLWYRKEGAPLSAGKKAGTLTTDATGKWMTEMAAAETINLRALFMGDSTLKSSQSDLMLVTSLKSATLTLESGTLTPKVGETYYLFGKLTDTETKTPMANAAVDMWARHPDEKMGRKWQTIMTDKDGKYIVKAASDDAIFIRGVFPGGTIHAPAYSNLVSVTPT